MGLFDGKTALIFGVANKDLDCMGYFAGAA